MKLYININKLIFYNLIEKLSLENYYLLRLTDTYLYAARISFFNYKEGLFNFVLII